MTAPAAIEIDWDQLEVETGDVLFDPPEAVFDKTRRYRYRLTRTWGDGPVLVVLMLNPSKADAFRNDPTITRVIDFAKQAGYGGIVVINLFAWRSKNPADLSRRGVEPVGPFNDAFILAECTRGRDVLAAWGANGDLKGRAAHVLAMLEAAAVPLLCLERTKDGHPGHPLYIPASTPFTAYSRAAEPAT